MAEKESLLNALLGLSMIVEARDPYTGGHLWRVSQFSKLLAQQAGLSYRDVALCEIGGFLHDLGKVGVPDAILNKPDRLTDAEIAVIRTHPTGFCRINFSQTSSGAYLHFPFMLCAICPAKA
jgi:HD-GYP domain-containing protein (c-di-GMP phosphodiesterase class II)